MQNPRILLFLINNMKDSDIIAAAKNKLKFIPLTPEEVEIYETIVEMGHSNPDLVSKSTLKRAEEVLRNQGFYQVHQPEYLSGANISIAITKEFMHAVEHDLDYQLRYPDIDNYTAGEKAAYDEKWHLIGDVRVWEEMGYPVRVHKTIRARELWNLINV